VNNARIPQETGYVKVRAWPEGKSTAGQGPNLGEAGHRHLAGFVRRRLGLKPTLVVVDDMVVAGGQTSVQQAPVGPDLWTTREVAEYLSLSRRTVSNWCGSGRIAAVKLGDDWRIPRAEVVKLARGEV
jgi:excisionase family DNA binding protein